MVMMNDLNVGSFILAYSLPPCAKDVLRTKDDCAVFLERFYETTHELIDDILDYREYKLASSFMTLDIFLKMCYVGEKKNAFEEAFVQAFTKEEMDFIFQRMDEGVMTLPHLYSKFQEDPEKNILSYFM